MALKELELNAISAAGVIAGIDAISAAAAAAGATPDEEAAALEKAGQLLVARCNEMRMAEAKYRVTFADAKASEYEAHRIAEKAKAAAVKVAEEAADAAIKTANEKIKVK